MTDPPTGGPEPPPTNTQETPTSYSVEDFQPRVPIEPLPRGRRRLQDRSPESKTGRKASDSKNPMRQQVGLASNQEPEKQVRATNCSRHPPSRH
jgi:hypothetical protein